MYLDCYKLYTLCVFVCSVFVGLFELFDVNCDGHIDLSEMIRGVAMCCRRHTDEKIKCE